MEFARELEGWRDTGRRETRFLIGAADGRRAKCGTSADLLLSFGPATWPHLLVRAMLAEQLFRATSILANHPYHREVGDAPLRLRHANSRPMVAASALAQPRRRAGRCGAETGPCGGACARSQGRPRFKSAAKKAGDRGRGAARRAGAAARQSRKRKRGSALPRRGAQVACAFVAAHRASWLSEQRPFWRRCSPGWRPWGAGRRY